jgi:hypothetical protein
MVAVHRLLISLGGALVAHQIGHVAAPGHVHDSLHGYVPHALALVLPLAALSFWRLAEISARTGRDAIRTAELAAAQLLIFVGQEGAERIVSAGTVLDLALDPILWVGLVAQTLVSGVLALSLRTARVLFRPYIRGGWMVLRSSPARIGRPRGALRPMPPLRVLPMSWRGPPGCVA